MKKILLTLVAGVFICASMPSCAKCYVCTDKDSTSFAKYEYCDKDFDSGDVDLAIQAAEANGASCRRKARII